MLLVDNRHLGPPRSLIRTYFFSSLCIRVIFIYTHIYIFIYLYNPKICVLMVCVYTCLLYVYFWMFKGPGPPSYPSISHNLFLSSSSSINPFRFFSPFARSFITKFLKFFKQMSLMFIILLRNRDTNSWLNYILLSVGNYDFLLQ